MGWYGPGGGFVAAVLALPAVAGATPIVVVGDDGDLPARCDVRRVATAVTAFFDGFGTGGLTKETRRFAPEPACTAAR